MTDLLKSHSPRYLEKNISGDDVTMLVIIILAMIASILICVFCRGKTYNPVRAELVVEGPDMVIYSLNGECISLNGECIVGSNL
jgi:hypothetical protein